MIKNLAESSTPSFSWGYSLDPEGTLPVLQAWINARRHRPTQFGRWLVIF